MAGGSTALKIQSVKPPTAIYSYLVTVGNGMKDIVLVEPRRFKSPTMMLTGWSQAQWNNNGRLGVQLLGGQNGAGTTCVSLTGSHIHHIHTALVLGTNNSLVDSNEIDHFGEDAIDYVANNIAITRNDIHDLMDYGTAAHSDAMQGYPGLTPAAGVVPSYNTFTNILIDFEPYSAGQRFGQSVPLLPAGHRQLQLCRNSAHQSDRHQQCDFDASVRGHLFLDSGERRHRQQYGARRRHGGV